MGQGPTGIITYPVEKMNYSVPYEYVGNYVDVKLTKSSSPCSIK